MYYGMTGPICNKPDPMRFSSTYFVQKSRERKIALLTNITSIIIAESGTSGTHHSEPWNFYHKEISRVER